MAFDRLIENIVKTQNPSVVGLAVFLELLFLDVFRNIVKLWVKTHY